MNPTVSIRLPDWGLVICIGLFALAVFALHFPGQATYDTLAQAYDGATRIYTSNQPPAMSLLLSVLSLPGVLALQVALFSCAVWRLLALSRGTVHTQYVLLLALFLFPVLLIYVGIVWKDVLFAHGALLAMLLLPGGALDKQKKLLAISAVVLAVAVAVRQQAMTIAVVAAMYLLLAEGWRGLKCKSRWLLTFAWISMFVLCSAGIKCIVQSSGDTSQANAFEGPFRQLAMFDLGGILSQVPSLEFPTIEAGAMAVPETHRPDRDRVRGLLGRYSPDRQDYMVDPDASTDIWVPPPAWMADWRHNVPRYPLAYIAHRMDVLSWMLGCHGPEKCLPYTVGIPADPEHMAAALGVTPGLSTRAQRLGELGNASLFLFLPWVYVCLSIATLACMLLRGGREHGPIIALQIGGLLYAASYLLIGFACDFRYTYFTTVAALFGVAYVIGVMSQPRFAVRSAAKSRIID